jgi:hypothetical protein
MKCYRIMVLFMIILACSRQQVIVDPPPKPDTDTTIRSGTSFGMCLGYCWQELEIASTALVFTRKNWMMEEFPPVTIPGEITVQEWDRLVQLIDQKPLREMENIYGCPDCADGGAEWIEVIQDDFSKKITFEFGDSLVPIQDLLDEVRRIRKAYESM